MKKPKILVVGSLAIDLTVTASRFVAAGETIIGTGFSSACGGKGANQAVQAARLGAEVTMVGRVGNDPFGRTLIDCAQKDGIDVSHISVSAAQPTGCANIQIASCPEKTENRIVIIPGANMDISAREVEFLKRDIKNYDMVLLQFEIPMEINRLVAGYAYSEGVPVMLNCAPYAPVPAELLSALTFISPNEHEAKAMTGVTITDEESARRAAGIIHGKGAEKVIITLGSKGAAFSDGKGFLISPAIASVSVLDPTAAGDSFVSAFCFAIASGFESESALAFANCAASVTVSRMGAQPSLPTFVEVKKAVEKHGVKLNRIL